MRFLGVVSLAIVGALVVAFVLERPPAVEVRDGGIVLVDDKPASLRALRRACAHKGTVTVRAEGAVPWAHVEWVLAALRVAGAADVGIDLPGGAVTARLESAYWAQDVRHLELGHMAGIVTIGPDDLARSDLAAWLAREATGIACEHGLRPLAHVLPEPTQSFAVVAPALAAVRDAGLDLEVPVDWPVGELPDASVLPPPPDLWGMTLQHVSWQCGCRPGIRDLDLPVADMGEEDWGREEDDRLFLQMDPAGRVYCHRGLSRPPDALSLDAVAGVLREARERYDLKMRQQGKSGFEKPPDDGLSRLYVLIRADRAAAASHVGWVLHTLAREGYYKVQFAIRREPGEDQGPCRGALSGKLAVFLPTDNLPEIVSPIEPAIHVHVDPEAYGLGPTRGMDLETLEQLARGEYERARAVPGRKVVVAVHVAPGVAWGRVIAAVNTLARAGLEKIDFHGLPPPDEATRRMSPLPR